MDSITWSAFQEELSKVAGLDKAEQEFFRKAVRQHADFEQRSAAGKLDEAGQAAMRANVERLKAIRSKSKGESNKIPTWAQTLSGVPPAEKKKGFEGSGFGDMSGAPAAIQFMFKYPEAAGALLGAASGVVSGLATHALDAALPDSKAMKDHKRENAGPLGRYILDNPVKGRAAFGALGGAASLAGAIRYPADPFKRLALTLSAPLAVAGIDRTLKHFEDKKKAA